MGRKSKYTELQMQFLLDHLDMKNRELKILFEEKFGIDIDRHYIANLRIRVNKKEKFRFDLNIGDSYVDKESKYSDEVSEEVKENVNIFKNMAIRGVKNGSR
mgnify:CR=1 FL=1